MLHTFGVCAPTGVYKMKGGPRSSHYFAFQKILSTIYVYGDGNTTCILIRNFIKKDVISKFISPSVSDYVIVSLARAGI